MPTFRSSNKHLPRSELGPVVRTHVLGRPRYAISRSSTRVTRPTAEASVGFQRQALARVGIHHAEDAHHPPVTKPSAMKSIAHSWLALVSRDSSARSRSNRCVSCTGPSALLRLVFLVVTAPESDRHPLNDRPNLSTLT
jgi:hypothetical protein